MEMTYIYELTDPDIGIGRYIGKADDPGVRYRAHLEPSRLRADTYKNHWIKSLLQQGKCPGIKILMCCLNIECIWKTFEQAFIATYRIRQTHNVLTNIHDGGRGQRRGYEPSGEARRKISEAGRGRTLTKMHRQKISCANTGKRLTGATRQKISEANRGKKHTEEARRKMSTSSMGHAGHWRGKTRTKETRQKMSEAQAGEKNHKAKITDAAVIEVRELYATGKWARRALAERFGIAPSSVSHIVCRRTWKHLP